MTAVAAQKPKGKVADPVQIIQKPMVVRNCFYETDLPASPRVPVRPRLNRGRTDWHFPCLCKFEFKVEKDGNDQFSHRVAIKITAITINISLPVTVWRSNQLRGKLKAEIERHERGHVEIVGRIYAHAGKVAWEAARTVIGKTFSGQGKTKELAISSAILGAREAVCAPYRVKTAYAADVISCNYDRIEKTDDTGKEKDSGTKIDGTKIDAPTKDHKQTKVIRSAPSSQNQSVDQAFKEFKTAGHQL